MSWDKTQDKAKDPFLIAQNFGEVWRDKLKWLLLKGINSKGNLVRKKKTNKIITKATSLLQDISYYSKIRISLSGGSSLPDWSEERRFVSNTA